MLGYRRVAQRSRLYHGGSLKQISVPAARVSSPICRKLTHGEASGPQLVAQFGVD